MPELSRIAGSNNNLLMVDFVKKLFRHALIICISLIVIFPFIWMLSGSLKDSVSFFDFGHIIPKEVRWINYVEVWGRINLAVNFLNTLKLTIVITVLQILLSSFAAYAFAKINFPRRELLFILYVATLSIPFQVIMIPQFIMIKSFTKNAHLSIVLVMTFSPLGIFLFRQFFMNIPNDLIDSARIDGLNEYRIYFKILLPLSTPAVLTLGIFSVITVWNDYIIALLYIYKDRHKTIQMGMQSFFSSMFGAEYNLAMSVAVLSIIPVLILFIVLQKYLVEGIATTGIKG